MSNKQNTVRLTLEFDINDDLLSNKGLDPQTIIQKLIVKQDDVIDGINITREVNHLDEDVTQEFYIENERLISAQLKD